MILSAIRILGIILLMISLRRRGWSTLDQTLFLLGLACVFAGVEYDQ